MMVWPNSGLPDVKGLVVVLDVGGEATLIANVAGILASRDVWTGLPRGSADPLGGAADVKPLKAPGPTSS